MKFQESRGMLGAATTASRNKPLWHSFNAILGWGHVITHERVRTAPESVLALICRGNKMVSKLGFCGNPTRKECIGGYRRQIRKKRRDIADIEAAIRKLEQEDENAKSNDED